MHLDNKDFPTFTLTLCRLNGTSCIAAVDGKTVALVSRSQTVDLTEAVNELTLGSEISKANYLLHLSGRGHQARASFFALLCYKAKTTVRKYTGARKLTHRILNELIEIPTVLSLPIPEVS